VAAVEDGEDKSLKWPIQAFLDSRKYHLLGLGVQKAKPVGLIVFCSVGALKEEAAGGIKQEMKHLGGNWQRSGG